MKLALKIWTQIQFVFLYPFIKYSLIYNANLIAVAQAREVLPTPPLPVKNKYLVFISLIYFLLNSLVQILN